MTSFVGTPLEQITNSNSVRLRLLVCSLYLTAYEVLKSLIIEGVADFYVDQDPISDKIHEEFITTLTTLGLKPKEISEFPVEVETYSTQVGRYEQEVGKDYGLRFTQRRNKGLIPSCRWLQEEGVLDEEDIKRVRHFREQRNRIAHDLYEVLVSNEFSLDIDSLFTIRELLKKVELFWTRLYISIDHPEIYEIPDESIFCPRLFVIDQVNKSVSEHLVGMTQQD